MNPSPFSDSAMMVMVTRTFALSAGTARIRSAAWVGVRPTRLHRGKMNEIHIEPDELRSMKPTTNSLVQRVAEKAAGAMLRFDERLVDRADPHPNAPVPLDRLAWSAELASHFDEIASELDALLADGFRMPTTTEFAGEDLHVTGEWNTNVLAWCCERIVQTCVRMRATTAALRQIPNLQIAGFAVVGPDTAIEQHTGPAKSSPVRLGNRFAEPPASCGFTVGETTHICEPRGMVAFDDRSPHEAWNHGDGTRYVLFAQVAWPVRGLAGVVHRSIHFALGRFIGDYARRARELDAALNGGR